jgi:hypothetical protein
MVRGKMGVGLIYDFQPARSITLLRQKTVRYHNRGGKERTLEEEEELRSGYCKCNSEGQRFRRVIELVEGCASVADKL